MKFRVVTASIGVALCSLWATPSICAQTPTASATIPAIVTSVGDAYLPGEIQMVAPARTDHVLLHPQGRCALVIQNDAALPPSPATGISETGATALLLYDGRQNKTKTLWERRADGGKHFIAPFIAWLPGTDCAVVVTVDATPPLNNSSRGTSTHSLLFFNFEKSLSAKTLNSSASARFSLDISPRKPLYLFQETTAGKGTQQIWMGNANGTLGSPVTLSSSAFLGAWDLTGIKVYGFEIVPEPPAIPGAKPQSVTHWLEWDGPAPKQLSVRPPQVAQEPTPPVLPFVLKTSDASVPSRTKNGGATPLSPFYLETVDTPTDAPYHSVLVAPNADASFLLADKSAILYRSGGVLYAVPLVRLTSTAFAAAEKSALRQARQTALSHTEQTGLAIMEYLQDHDEKFPSQTDFADMIGPYARNKELLNGFTYVYPGMTPSSIENTATTIMGYRVTPGGRVVLFADRHVKWEDKP